MSTKLRWVIPQMFAAGRQVNKVLAEVKASTDYSGNLQKLAEVQNLLDAAFDHDVKLVVGLAAGALVLMVMGALVL